MKKSEIIKIATDLIKRDAYSARVCDELRAIGFDVPMMSFGRDMSNGKACGGIEILSRITGKAADYIFEQAVEQAERDIKEADYNIIKLLNLAGYNGEAYYKVVTQ